MSGTHLSDEVLQQFSLDPAACKAEEISHIGSCPDCQSAVAFYKALTNELVRLPAPMFDFDLAEAVIAQLEEAAAQPAEAPSVKQAKAGPALTIVIIAVLIGVPFWLFRRSAYFVFNDMSATFYWFVFATAGIVVGMFLLRLYITYQKVIKFINE